MGNWTTVNIQGTCSTEDVPKLKAAISYDQNGDYEEFHCLSATKGLCGLGDWSGETINRIGNLAERDYDVSDVADTLLKLAAVAPSLNVKIHVGADYEYTPCIATILCSISSQHMLIQARRKEIAVLKKALLGTVLYLVHSKFLKLYYRLQ